MEKHRKLPRVFIWSEWSLNKTNSFYSYFSSSLRGIPQTAFCLLSWQSTTFNLALLVDSLLDQYIILPRTKPDHIKQVLPYGRWQKSHLVPVSSTPSSIQGYIIPTITTHWYQDQTHSRVQAWSRNLSSCYRRCCIYLWFTVSLPKH